MAMVVKNNMSALRTLSTLNGNNNSLQESLSKVASGLKINTAKDDASGYAISERMRVQIRSLDQATQNSQNASSLMKIAEGAVERTVDILRTLKQKAIDAATDTNTDDDRATIQKELDQLIDQIDDNALVTFNGKYLLEGSRAQEGNAVVTHMTNSNLATDTASGSALTALRNRNGEILEINTGDKVTVSFVYQGKTYTSVMTSVASSSAFSDIYSMLNTAENAGTAVTAAGGGFAADMGDPSNIIGTNAAGKVIYTHDGSTAITLTASTAGLEGQIAGLSISVTDSEGNVKKATNTALDAFKTTIYASNKTADGTVSFQLGSAANQAVRVGLMDMRSEALGLKGSDGTTIKLTTRTAANAAIAAFDNALNKALDQQTTIGAISARLDYTASNLTTSSENVTAAESTIRDADMAKEMTNYTKNNVLLQAAQSMLAQANQNSSAVLSLLQ
ncbi:MAG: flagellin [Selenomonadaceae bacterium]|nr:flagellin [Selenomonadaceae bacterium]